MSDLLSSPEAMFDLWTVILMADTGRYLIAASVMSVIIGIFASRLAGRKLQNRNPKPGQIAREIRYSLLTSLIFSLNGFTAALGAELGLIQIYSDIAAFGWVYFAGALVMMIVGHDAYFYWTHRLIHHPVLFRHIHRTHHRSRTPTPWTAYAFDPGEAVINSLYVTIFTALVPTHPLAIFIFMTHMILRNVIGHSGYEIFPRGMKYHPLFGALTNVLHHDLHHRDMHHNYGLYFSWWDRIMETEHPDYLMDDAEHRAAVHPKQKASIAGNAAIIALGLGLGFAGLTASAPAHAEPVSDFVLTTPDLIPTIELVPCEAAPLSLCAAVDWVGDWGQWIFADSGADEGPVQRDADPVGAFPERRVPGMKPGHLP